MRWLRWISGVVWILSWRIIYLEIFRWHHLTRTLRFNPPPPLPGNTVRPKAGLPLITVCVTSVAAPLVFLLATLAERPRRRSPIVATRQPAPAPYEWPPFLGATQRSNCRHSD